MNSKIKLNEKWIKASILGTIWASSEIVFGSFLHNLKIPFSGNILTGIGLILLISVSYIWTDKGLFWRAGLITAIMKTISPSAVIFGPMIAIIMESVILEVSVRIFGLNMISYIIGAALAMSWNLFQRIANFIIFYGYNIIELYNKLVLISQEQLNVRFDNEWLPILLLLTIYIVLGIIAAILGIRIGRKLQVQSTVSHYSARSRKFSTLQKTLQSDFHHSLSWLFTNILLITGALILLSCSNWILWSLSIIALVTIWTTRYKRVIKQLARPKFWIYFVLITMLIALIFKNNTSIEMSLLTGIKMNFRAAVLILGFAVLGTELYNPRIREFFRKNSFEQLSLALELSFESLPSTIANIPDAKSIIKKPTKLLYEIISQVENRLEEIKNKNNLSPKIFIITGAIGQGKTTYIQKITKILLQKNIPIHGIYSAKIIENNITVGYDIVDVKIGESEVFLSLTGKDDFDKIGKFYIHPEGLQKGKNILCDCNINNNEIVVIDEIGLLELEDKGWASCLQKIISNSKNHILLTVRDKFVEELTQKWYNKETYIYNISEYDYKTIGNSIIESIKN